MRRKTAEKLSGPQPDFMIPTPVRQFEVGGQVVVGISADEWGLMVKIVEDYLDVRDAIAVLDDPKSVFIPLEEARKSWFDNNIKKVRKKKRVTQKELAKRLRVSQSRISQIEDPDHRPTTRVYERVAKALGCEIEDLISLGLRAEQVSFTPYRNK